MLKNSASPDKKATKLDAVTNELKSRLTASVYDIGFLEATLDNREVSRVMNNSFSGHALDIAIRAVVSKIVLFICRNLDSNGNSLPTFLRYVEGMADYIEQKRKDKHPTWPEAFLEVGEVIKRIEKLDSDVRKLQESKAYKAIRIYRDEVLAHHLKDTSSYRKALVKSGEDFGEASYSQVAETAIDISQLVEEAIRIWTFHVANPEEHREISKRYCLEFWSILPPLSDLEKTKAISN